MCTPPWACVLQKYLDHSVSAEEKLVIDRHLITCRKCRTNVSAELKRIRTETPGSHSPDEQDDEANPE
jgi:hypothetical protein